MTPDRRSGNDRRDLQRFKVNIDIEWEGLSGREKGTVSDISVNGCFVLCSGDVEDGDRVKIYLPLTDGRKIPFTGEVANHVFEIGFAARFVELTEAQKDFIEVFVDTLRED
jgi:hypothetical protein